MDHGVLYGDSIYETLRAYEGTPFRWDAHLGRLRRSADKMELDLPSSAESLRGRVGLTLEAAGEPSAAIRIVITRGVGPMDLDPSKCGEPNVLIYVRRRPVYQAEAYRDGVAVRIVSRRRNPRRSLDPDLKSGNYLNNLLALTEARKAGAFEAVMLNAEGHVTECSTSNVFLVSSGNVVTPGLASGLLSGITRRTVLELCAREGIPCAEREVSPEELRAADEVFITSALKQVLPVTRVDEKPVGTGRAGPVTLRLLAAYRTAGEAETGVPAERQ
jgi:branched-chain amino acid aminotransferase